MANIIVDIPVIRTAPCRAVLYHTVLYDHMILKDYTRNLAYGAYGQYVSAPLYCGREA